MLQIDIQIQKHKKVVVRVVVEEDLTEEDLEGGAILEEDLRTKVEVPLYLLVSVIIATKWDIWVDVLRGIIVLMLKKGGLC